MTGTTPDAAPSYPLIVAPASLTLDNSKATPPPLLALRSVKIVTFNPRTNLSCVSLHRADYIITFDFTRSGPFRFHSLECTLLSSRSTSVISIVVAHLIIVDMFRHLNIRNRITDHVCIDQT